VNASTLRTVASSVDFIFELFQKAPRTNLLDRKPVEILVVDDEILSRRAVSYALEKAGLKAASVEEPQTALTQASEKQFDLIFLDVQMPGLDGFELCTKIRAVPLNKTTPVIFVTNLNDLKSRARSSLSGGNDFIAKPFMFIELSVKALTYVMRNRLAAGAAAPEAAHPKLAAA
jgi:PleD family two-component response regulator